MTQEFTICIKCKFYRCLRDSAYLVHNQVCIAKENQKEEKTNFVNGIVERSKIYCRDVNKEGNCPMFEKKKGWF